MALEYHTVNFTNDARGIATKNTYTAQLASEGWHITTETIEPGHMKGGEACCGFMLCAPLAFLAGRTPGQIVTTFARETSLCPQCGARMPKDAVFCRSCGGALGGSAPSSGTKVCNKCGTHVKLDAIFCKNCANRL